MPKAGYTTLVREPKWDNFYAYTSSDVVDYSVIVTPESEFIIYETIEEGNPYLAPYGFKLSVGGVFKGVGHAISGVVKGVGRVIHYGAKFVGQAAPILVPLAVGIGVGAIAQAAGLAGFAKASALGVAKSLAAGHIAAAATEGVMLASKVVITNVVSGEILKAIYKAPKGQPAIVAVGKKPAIIIPPFVREIVEPHHLVDFATQKGGIKNSKLIQQRIDWLAKKIIDTGKRIVALYRVYGFQIDEHKLLAHLREIFWNLPSTQAEVERVVNAKVNKLKHDLKTRKEMEEMKIRQQQMMQQRMREMKIKQQQMMSQEMNQEQENNQALVASEGSLLGDIPKPILFGGVLLLIVLLLKRRKETNAPIVMPVPIPTYPSQRA
jgi:hypothetical protein